MQKYRFLFLQIINKKNMQKIYSIFINKDILLPLNEPYLKFKVAEKTLGIKVSRWHYDIYETKNFRKTQRMDIRLGDFRITGQASWEDLEHRRPLNLRLFYREVWSKIRYTLNVGDSVFKELPGRLSAIAGEECPFFGDVLGENEYTHVCYSSEADDLNYWLEYVLGPDCILKKKKLYIPFELGLAFSGHIIAFRSMKILADSDENDIVENLISKTGVVRQEY